jgi:hypothetical protein
MAWEYGPTAPGAASVEMISLLAAHTRFARVALLLRCTAGRALAGKLDAVKILDALLNANTLMIWQVRIHTKVVLLLVMMMLMILLPQG